jgi:hypothetical protein
VFGLLSLSRSLGCLIGKPNEPNKPKKLMNQKDLRDSRSTCRDLPRGRRKAVSASTFHSHHQPTPRLELGARRRETVPDTISFSVTTARTASDNNGVTTLIEKDASLFWFSSTEQHHCPSLAGV